MTTRGWVVPACSAAAGLVAGYLFAEFPGKPAAQSGAAVPSIAMAPAKVFSDGGVHAGWIDDVRIVVREELLARDQRAAAAGQAPGPMTAPEPKTASQEMATARAGDVLASALGRRQWTESDAAALRTQFFQMSGEDQAEVLRVFSQAVNQGRLSVETEQMPF